MTDKPKKKIWSRRDFLMQSGGGIAGLAAAYRIQQEISEGSPLECTLVECGDRFGG